ncbi:MAG: VacJ family lipoprotein [Paracoccaceae bacterium]|nr:VacJ family lipoprotein [Paracoccaceae bacterium]
MRHLLVRCALLLGLVALAACSTPDEPVEIYDPYEADNRQSHEFNRNVDSLALRPAATGYGTLVPVPVRMGVSNFSANLGIPGTIVNDLLQGSFGDAAHNSFRFVLNSTLGLGGLFDVATPGGFEERSADFGQTLAVWGAPEGAYLDVPLFGPRTERALAGNIVDIVLNPVNYVFGPEYAMVIYGAGAATVLDDRYVLGDTLDAILYESADSYALLRSLYLQNRRFELNQSGTAGPDLAFDPYEDLYGDIFEE